MQCARAVALLAAALPAAAAAAAVRARPQGPKVQPVIIPDRTRPTRAPPRLRAAASAGNAPDDVLPDGEETTCNDCTDDNPCLATIDNSLFHSDTTGTKCFGLLGGSCLDGETNCRSADSEEEAAAEPEAAGEAEADGEDPAGPGAQADADGGEEDGPTDASVSVQ